jgi:hypothetical protein
MKKIPTIFERDWDGDRSRVIDKPHPDCGWVFAGEGVATRKIDGTCCLIDGGQLWKRREIKRDEPYPSFFRHEGTDPETGKTVGWVLIGDGPEDRWHREAFAAVAGGKADGTYELVGPKIQGNPEGYTAHTLIAHSWLAMPEQPPRDFEGLKAWLAGKDIEGIVFHHLDGRMAKIKLRDFGVKRLKQSA